LGAVKPTFLIIGAAKSGTTSLHWMLAQHPDVFMSPIKETNYFAYDESRADQKRFRVRSREAYLDLFCQGAGHPARGEASPAYMENPKAAERIHSELPDARLIAILRDPVERAYSLYRMNLRLKKRPFDAKLAFAADAGWLQPGGGAARSGRYAERLRPFLDRFPRDRIKLLLFEDLKNDPHRLLDDVFGFLGLETARIPWPGTRHNYGGRPRSPLLERAIRATRIGPLLRRRPRLQGIVRRLRNASLADPPRLPREVRARLIDAYRDDVLELEKLLGRDLSAWRSESPQP
jgi:hypothetical protein